MPKIEREEDPRVVVMSTRERHLSRPANDLVEPMWGEPAGQAIGLGARDKDEAARLWSCFHKADLADETYMRRIIGKHRFPNVAKVEFLPESFETRPDDRPDTRTADEKDRDAVNAWMRLQGFLGRLNASERHAIASVMRRRVDPVKGNALTTAGQAFVCALRTLDHEMNKR